MYLVGDSFRTNPKLTTLWCSNNSKILRTWDTVQLQGFLRTLKTTWTSRDLAVLVSRTLKWTRTSTATMLSRSLEQTRSQSLPDLTSKARASNQTSSLGSLIQRMTRVKIMLTIENPWEVIHQTRCRNFQWASLRTMEMVACHIKVTGATTWRVKIHSIINKSSSKKILTVIVSRVVHLLTTNRSHQLLQISSINLMEMDQMKLPLMVKWRLILLEMWKNTQDRKLKTDLEIMIRTVSTCYQAETSLILKDTTLTRKATINSVATMTRWLENIFQAPNLLTCQCRRTKVIMQAQTTEIRTRKIGSEDLTTVCKMTLNNFDATMEASMLIRTTKASMVSNIQTFCLQRAECIEMHMVQMVVSWTPSKTSTEGTLQMGLT